MCSNTLAELNLGAQTIKRAQYEAFEFDLEASGLVRVRNGSYGDEADKHTYRVTVEKGVPVSWTCKADEYGSGACKHRIAIAIREPVLAAASARGPDRKRALADGGMVVDPKTQEESAETTHAPGCDILEWEGYTADGRLFLSWECWVGVGRPMNAHALAATTRQPETYPIVIASARATLSFSQGTNSERWVLIM